MDAAIPADAQNAPTGIWKSRTEREIPTAPTPIIVVVNERKNNGDSNSVAKLSTESDQAHIPTVAVKSLGPYPESRSDLYGFFADRIIFPPVSSIRDVQADALAAFFSGDWPTRFEQYDASYLRPQSAIGSEVRREIAAIRRRPLKADMYLG